ncbi:hypothetical protein R1flu_010319 [Riccia fluitans]|uniref:Ribosomal protein S12 n=1 Tax=Riccia fluitans TaxID=41844 RepID=A0ABD1Z4M8_9MARC
MAKSKLPPNTAPCRLKHGRRRRTRFIGHRDRDTKARPVTATVIVNPGTHPAKSGIAASRRVADDRRGDRANASGNCASRRDPQRDDEAQRERLRSCLKRFPLYPAQFLVRICQFGGKLSGSNEIIECSRFVKLEVHDFAGVEGRGPSVD